MKGKKGTVDEGGTRVFFFLRWPGKVAAGECDRIARHIDLLPTFAASTGAKPKEADKLQGRSLIPLMEDPKTDWNDRYLFFHKGRWASGKAEESKDTNFAVRSQRWRLVGGSLFDMEKDPGQKTNVIDQHPEVVSAMLKSYDKWWAGALPNMFSENSTLEERNSFKLIFWEQYNMPIPERKVKKPREKKKKKKNKV